MMRSIIVAIVNENAQATTLRLIDILSTLCMASMFTTGLEFIMRFLIDLRIFFSPN